MIKRLKIRFISLSMAALFILLVLMVACMNLLNYHAVVEDADAVLSLLSQNQGVFPSGGESGQQRSHKHISPETPYESRYFSVVIDSNGQVLQTDTSKIAAIDSEAAKTYALSVLEKGAENGFINGFRYSIVEESETTRITFLDCGKMLNSFYDFLNTSTLIALLCYLFLFVVILFFSGRIIRPAAESYAKQKQFITNASHEIKTPLTIINANLDLLEMDPQDTDSLQDIRAQTERLASLTNDLVCLAQMEEPEKEMEKTEVLLSDLIAEAVLPFKTLAQTQKKHFICQIQPSLSIRGSQKAITQLLYILLDNALKYSPEEGTVAIHFAQQGHQLRLNVFNTTQTYVNWEDLQYVFDRFFRADRSRNSASGGYGIGLSIAKAIMTAHGGKIQTGTQGGYSFTITCLFPI